MDMSRVTLLIAHVCLIVIDGVKMDRRMNGGVTSRRIRIRGKEGVTLCVIWIVVWWSGGGGRWMDGLKNIYNRWAPPEGKLGFLD